MSDNEDEHILEDEEDEENKAFLRVLDALRQYEITQLQWLREKEVTFMKLPEDDLRRISGSHTLAEGVNISKTIISDIRERIRHNQQFLEQLILPYGDLFPNQSHNSVGGGLQANLRDQLSPAEITVFHSDIERVKTTLRQLAREWSSKGESERKQAFDPILNVLDNYFPKENRTSFKILTPGCGLGRLTWEIAKQGFASQGNEFSFFMLITSNAILNSTSRVGQWNIFPWIHTFCNWIDSEDQISKVAIPDVLPSDLPKNSDFSMGAGDFLDVYTEPNSWDSVVTCFFLDTAHNVIEYIRTISKILKPGGIWINNGPLLYHWTDMLGEQSVELTFNQIRNVIESFGLEIKTEEMRECIYTDNVNSMMHVVYNSKFFVAIKPL